MDILIPHLHIGETKAEGPHTSLGRTTLMVFAVTLHNIPEGMAMGLAFANAGINGARRRIMRRRLHWLSVSVSRTFRRAQPFPCP